jgi:hypothetical protein
LILFVGVRLIRLKIVSGPKAKFIGDAFSTHGLFNDSGTWFRYCKGSKKENLVVKKMNSKSYYEIKVKDQLNQQWSLWFDGMKITNNEDGTTILSGWVTDQAALHGLLERIRDLNMILISVNPISPEQAE